MKKFKVGTLAILAIVLAVGSAFTTLTETKWRILFNTSHLQGTTVTNQDAVATYSFLSSEVEEQTSPFTSPELNDIADAYCVESPKICLVAVKMVDNSPENPTAQVSQALIRFGEFSAP